MGLFRRRVADPATVRARQDEAIAAFWAWWLDGARERVAAVFDGRGDPSAAADELAPRVEAVHAGLAFETGAGRTARHVLVVTAAGDPDLRDVADRWLAAAPPADDAFEYDAWRQAVPDPSGLSIDLGSGALRLDEMLAAVEPDGGRTHVEAYHPRFADLPDEARGQITFLLLDAVLGERVVEERVGAVSWTDRRPADGVPFTTLRAVVGTGGPGGA